MTYHCIEDDYRYALSCVFVGVVGVFVSDRESGVEDLNLGKENSLTPNMVQDIT
jgi:hypothetical protein